MNYKHISLNILNIVFWFFGGIYVLCGIVSYIYFDVKILTFFSIAGISCLVLGAIAFSLTPSRLVLRAKDGFIITSVSYVSLGLVGALPFLVLDTGVTNVTDGVFEAVSGLTTTGATVLTGLDDMHPAILFYRQVLQWFGGMGIILLVVAILPLLGIGGMQLFKAEASGSAQQNIRPRVRETAKTLWLFYVGLTIMCAAAYWIAGMTLFDAICHSFSTVALGGFSTHDASIGFFNSVAIELVCIVFMLFAAVNFTLHFASWNQFWNSTKTAVHKLFKRNVTSRMIYQAQGGARAVFRIYFNDYEFRLFGGLTLALILISCIELLGYLGLEKFSLGDTIFQSVAFITTAGFSVTAHGDWPMSVTFLLILFACAGGCVGSTAGGLKMFRVLIILQQGWREIYRLLYPNGVFLIKLHKDFVPDRIVDAVWGLFALYIATLVILIFIVITISDMDFVTAFSAVAACLANLGPGLGDVAANYQNVTPAVKWVLVVAMILGRLEIITILILLVPKYWRI